LLDALTVDELNEVSQEYLQDFVQTQEAQDTSVQFFIDHAELLSQTFLSEKAESNVKQRSAKRDLAAPFVNLWVSVAFRGFSINLSLEDTTEHLVSGIDSFGYTNAIQLSGNPYLAEAYAFSAAEKAEDIITPVLLEEAAEDESTSTTGIVAFVVVFTCVVTIGVAAYCYHKRSRNGLPCPVFRTSKEISERQAIQSSESQNVVSPVGSAFSFEDSATAGTRGLMRFIGSFSPSRDSTSPCTTAQKSTTSMDERDDESRDEEAGGGTPESEEDNNHEGGCYEEDDEDDEPHPLTGFIPPMIVYDHIDDDEEADELGAKEPPSPSKRSSSKKGPAVVPSKHVEASESFIAALGSRSRPSHPSEFSEYVR
jgi:hypothetical protein